MKAAICAVKASIFAMKTQAFAMEAQAFAIARIRGKGAGALCAAGVPPDTAQGVFFPVKRRLRAALNIIFGGFEYGKSLHPVPRGGV
jgi:hypothetical protein